MFDVSIYTDSTKSEALDGVVGFNFQSASEGFTPTDQNAVQKHLLHEVTVGWSITNDPLAHPPSYRYRPVGDRFYLARGRSTGETNNGRPGNQLTQSLVTGDADDFIPYRPAQLFGARRWNLEKTSGKSLDPWATPLDIDPEFEATELKDALLGDPWARQMFPTFLTMIEQAAAGPSKKLVIVHDDLTLTMKWIALGTLFLDPKRAGAVRFAALVKNPLAVDAEIVGTSPVFDAPPPAVRDVAYNVFDLLDRQVTPVEVSESAAEQAAWFAEMDADDALAAVDLARSWEAALGPSDATRLAQIIHLDGVTNAVGYTGVALRAIPGMLETGQEDDVAMYADELLSVATSTAPSNKDEARSAARASWSARQAGIGALAAELTVTTLRSLSDQPDLITAWSSETADLCTQSETRPADSIHQRCYEEILVETINTAPAQALSDLLIVAQKFDIRVPPAAIGSGLVRFEEEWSRNPDLAAARTRRAYRNETTSGAVARVLRLLDGGDEAALADLRDRRWHWVAEEMRTPLDGWIAVADLAALPLADRVDRLDDRLRSVGLPPQSWTLALSGMTWPGDCRLVARWIEAARHVPESMTRWLAGEINRTLTAPEEQAAAMRPVLIALRRSDVQIAGRDLDRILDDLRLLSQSFEAAQRVIDRTTNRALEDFAVRLGPYRPFYRSEIGELFVDARDTSALRKLATASGESAGSAMTEALRRMFDGNDPAGTLEAALYLNLHGLAVQTEGAHVFLTQVADSRELRARVERLRRDLRDEWAEKWDEFLADSKKGRLTRNLVRGGKRLFGKEDHVDG